MRVFVVLAFIGILASLASALVYLMRDKGTTSRTVNALTVRIGLSVALFLFVLFAHHMGWIEAQALDRHPGCGFPEIRDDCRWIKRASSWARTGALHDTA